MALRLLAMSVIGCIRWNGVLGEAVGLLVKFASERKVLPRGVREDKGLLEGFQEFVRGEGIELEWGELRDQFFFVKH